MAAPQEEYSYIIAAEDIDPSLLPPTARTPGTEAFRQAVTSLIQKDYADFGGYVRIVLDKRNVQVHWRSDPSAPDPRQVALHKLEQGEYAAAARALEILLRHQPADVDVLYNLGMALSDMGRLPEAEKHLRQAVDLDPNYTNALVALGVALARQRRHADAVGVLRRAVLQAPHHPLAQRNLGACLLQTGQGAEAEKYLRRAVELNPSDQQALLGLAEALEANGQVAEADALYTKVIDMDGRSPAADAARDARTRLVQSSFRAQAPGSIRPDAVMFLLGALRDFGAMSRQDIQKIGVEIALLGQRGLDANDSSPQYQLRSLPGQYSGLHMLCMMYVAFQMIAPEHSIGFDLSKEFEVAKTMYDGSQKKKE